MTVTRSVLVAVLAAAVILLAVVIGWEPGSKRPEGPSSGLKVIVLGIDGADWFMLSKLLEEGVMESLTPLMKLSITGEIAADTPAVPDVGWTILARGMSLTDQEATVVRTGDGRLRGLSPVLADLVEAGGGKSLSVGWPASWPAGDSGGLLAAPFQVPSSVHGTGLPSTLFRDGVSQTLPDTLERRVDRIVARNEGLYEQEFRRVVFDGEAMDDGWSDNLLAAQWAFLSDLITLDTAASLIASEQPDLTLMCLSGLDAVGHRFLAPAMPDYFAELPPGSARYSNVLKNYYAFVDRGIERIRRLADENTVLIICSVYGTHPSADVAGMSGSHVNGPPGVLIARGLRMAPTPRPVTITTRDIAPTVLAILGLRIPTNLEGRVVQELVPQGLLREHPATYSGLAEAATSRPTTEDVEAMERLAEKRLGLIRSGAAW
ncbi:MAG: alkaline phosphatase family protein [Candidatus Eisenbacteria bacterium]|nr:alkaline phosphatase family protein [Candidatus Eisenbacteria bacterium]